MCWGVGTEIPRSVLVAWLMLPATPISSADEDWAEEIMLLVLLFRLLWLLLRDRAVAAACLLTAFVMDVFNLESATRGETSRLSPSLPLSLFLNFAAGPSMK